MTTTCCSECRTGIVCTLPTICSCHIKKEDVCAWCGKIYAKHDEPRPIGSAVPRVPCLLLKSGYVSKGEVTSLKESTPNEWEDRFERQFGKYSGRQVRDSIGPIYLIKDFIAQERKEAYEEGYYEGEKNEFHNQSGKIAEARKEAKREVEESCFGFKVKRDSSLPNDILILEGGSPRQRIEFKLADLTEEGV